MFNVGVNQLVCFEVMYYHYLNLTLATLWEIQGSLTLSVTLFEFVSVYHQSPTFQTPYSLSLLDLESLNSLTISVPWIFNGSEKVTERYTSLRGA